MGYGSQYAGGGGYGYPVFGGYAAQAPAREMADVASTRPLSTEDRKRAAQHADQIIFEGFRP
mgnify:CR=1 FL=1